ncbi:LOW QUALITY PROTEIN: myosin-binding protein H-like [Solanum pennellii]|uniref:LOW QUALITY PROTEIN: myosin-binding protein H-like n=1 Tax=Solanum pennellii TaxID=28526 RepID=A0ABM1VH61_SOLPN|nr:LOW QUALITY PROTEIN: myosin-binding protein H-like [Solanum pennellii]
MEIWPKSTNPTVAPPKIKSMPGRPGKLRKKEAGESKKYGKLPRTGLAMTCSNCNVRGHNKRGCPQRVESSAREEPSNTDKGKGKTSGLGRPKNAQTEAEHSTKRSRERPHAKPNAYPGPAKRSRGRPYAITPSASPGPAKRSRGRPPSAPSASPRPSASAAPTKGARGRPPATPSAPNASTTHAKSARGRPPATPSEPSTCALPDNSNKEEEGVGETQPHTKGKQSLQWPGMSSCKIFSTGSTKVTKSADVSGDIGYKPSTAPKL